jgi:hypothetical protein
MNLDQFIELVDSPQPSLGDLSDIMDFAQNADMEVLWEALQRPHLHAVVVAMLANVLQHKIQHARTELGMPEAMQQVRPEMAGKDRR